jgi:protein SCO1/2
MNRSRLARSVAAPLALLLLLPACGAKETADATAAPPLAGAAIGGPFALIDQNGRAVTDRSFAGRFRIMYFGYTFCPDVCPTDMATVGAAMKLLDASDRARSSRVQPIFVSVDPARDTPPVLKQFVAAFYPRMVGLTGTPTAIAAVAKQFGIYASKGAASADGGYLVNHSRQAYLMDRDGKPLALLPVEQGPQAVADEVKHWTR